MQKFSKRSTKLVSSPLYVFFKKVKEQEALGRQIISLGVGEPSQDTPEAIKQAGIEAIKSNQTHYNPATGSTALKQALAARYQVSTDQVVISSGAKPFLSSIIWSLLDEGDVMFMAGPYYPPFMQIAQSCGAEVVLVDTKPAEFQLTKTLLEQAYNGVDLTGRSGFIIINSPNNPTGVDYDLTALTELVEFCQAKHLTIISDECYSNFSPAPSFSLRQLDENIIVINSFSKTYAMTGWRVGYAILPTDLSLVVGRYLENYLGCASSISDAAALVALKTEPLADFIEQRTMIHAWLEQHQIPHVKSTGGIFIFPDFAPVMAKQGITNSIDLATYFLEQASVATTPGSSFGAAYDTHLRLSYCIEIAELQRALDKLGEII